METNLLIAIANLAKKPVTNLALIYKSSNRANNMGDPLEFYIKDLFCGSLGVKDTARKNKIYSKFFSYTGNQNNPPDVMLKKGDAIEIKKIESLGSALALNSSYPKNKLYSSNPMITKDCAKCEDWKEKDLVYIIGAVVSGKLKSLWMVYGDCYAANKKVYEKIRGKIAEGIKEITDVEFSETNELGRVNKVDPLGITYLRIRGMWAIENPMNVFNYVAPIEKDSEFSFNAIMLKEKYVTFPKEDRALIEKIKDKNFSIKNIEIKSPNNPAKLLKAKLISYKK